MGILDGLMGNASENSVQQVQREIDPILVEGEKVEKAYKIIRDGLIFTNKRLVIIDKRLLDLDAELKIQVSSSAEPIQKKFNKKTNINEVYAILSKYVLG